MAEEKKIGFDWARFIKVQQNLPKVTKAGTGNYGSYMKLEDLNPKLLKVLNENGFAWVTRPTVVDGQSALRYDIIDMESGESFGDIMKLAMDKQTPQGQGSAITYARRYSLAAITGMVSDIDDDGQAGSQASDDKSQSLEQLNDQIQKFNNINDMRKFYAELNPTEKKIALPIIQEKSKEFESA
jgi:hypothetical protein